ncbi:MAG: preprotein translocase subunit Sec61beta [Candidatus Jordarchaeum sp.]|uniref:preprotein translocase subunit Sec61beta n=1 Tax=Candidatus Jordarchaeum sp. TaxID=2823881 RepID=UPI00404A6A2D
MKKRRARDQAPMPVAGAGLIRFFDEETVGPKIGPSIVVIMCVAVIVVIILSLYFASPNPNIPGLPQF